MKSVNVIIKNTYCNYDEWNIENLQLLHEQGDAHLHLYGKKETKPGRKMGHITVLNASRAKLISQLKWIRESISIKS